MRGDLTLAVDIGTSSCKIGVYDRKGELLFAAKRDYPSFSPQPSFAEQDPKDILRNISEAVKEAVEQYTPHSFAILAFDTMLHSTIFIDREGNPLYPLLNWMDTRSAGEVEELQGEYQAHGFYFRNGVPLHTIYHLPRVFWFRKNKPHILHETWKVVAIKDWILWKLTGVLLCDYSTASGTGFLNLSQCEWDAEILEMAEFPVEKLPELCEPEHVAPLQDSEFQRETGLPVALPVIWGGGDGPYANLGEGMFHQGEMVVTVGSSGAVRMCDRKPVFDPAGRCWCYYLADGIWVAGGGINNGGIVYSWMKDIAGESDCWEIDLHRPRPLFLPFLVGERSPNWDAYARGVLFGLSYFHDRDALMQSTFEAVAFRIRSIEEMLQRVVGEPHRVVVSGGFAISEKGSRVLCDTLGVPVFLSSLPSAPTKGAFLLSRKVLGEVTTLDQLSPDYFPDNPLLEPIPERVQFYTELYRFYLKLYQANAPLFREFSQFHLS